MLFMDLTINDTLVYQGQAVFGQIPVRTDIYLEMPGIFIFVDTQGLTDPQWEGLGDRYRLGYFDSTGSVEIPLSATPVQNLAVVLSGQNCIIGLYDQTIDTTLSVGHSLPVGADAGYTRQEFLA